MNSEKLYSDFIYTRSYSRWNPEESRRELWPETVNRYSDFFINRVPKRRVDDFKEAVKMIEQMKVMPSMRALWSAGPALERDNAACYNCSFMTISNIKSFSEMMYISMCGVGVGFSVERQFINRLPEIPNNLEEKENAIVQVADSKVGWSKGFHDILKYLYDGAIPKYDLSKVRPSGSILKTFGGRASGPEPLKNLFDFVINLFKSAKGRKLNSIECYDICCYILMIVVAGGVRRSAGISLSNLSDDRMARSKYGEFWIQNNQRQMCNNSVAYTEKPDVSRFLKEWMALIDSKTGERGIFNREGAKFHIMKTGRRDVDHDFGINPCQPYWATVLTPTGISKIGNIKIGDTIWSEDGWVKVVNKNSSGIKDVMRYRTSSGVFYGTDYHRVVSDSKKVEVKNADSIDSLSGNDDLVKIDDTVSLDWQYLYGSRNTIASFLRRLFSSDGEVVENKIVITIPLLSVIEDVQVMLSSLGVSSYYEENVIVISDIDKFSKNIGFIQKYKTDKLNSILNKKKTYDIISRDYISTEEVFNITVDGKSNTYWTGGLNVSNCGEIILRPNSFCNLSEVIIRPDDTFDSLRAKVKNATILGCLQSTMTDFSNLRRIWKNNCEEERLLGVSLTGLLDHPILNKISKKSKSWLGSLREEAIETAKDWSNALDINIPTAITATKPSGCRPWDGIITTESGIYTLEDMMENHTSESEWCDVDGIKSVGGGSITKTFINGIEEVLKINMNLGMSVESTSNHEWYVKDVGWVRAEDLSVGDVLEIVPNLYNNKNDKVSPELSWMLGYLRSYCDISIFKSKLRFMTEENINKLTVILKSLFDADVIPKVIRESSKESIIAFIAGLIDADGWYDNGKLVYTTNNNTFANHVQHIGWAVGICLGNSKNVGDNNYQKMYLLELLGNSDNESLDLLVKHCGKATKDLIAYRDKNISKPGVIKSIEVSGKKPTYDIETDENWFYAGSVKSHNTVSQLCGCSSGIHSRYSQYYIRRVRVNSKDPLSRLMIDKGFKFQPELGQTIENNNTLVFEFPIKSPDTSVMKDEVPSLYQLEYWKMIRDFWCEHNPSVTIYVKDNEWVDVGAWVYRNWNSICGLSFLPYDTGVYKLAPYEEIDEDVYNQLVKELPDIDFSELSEYEKEDMTEGSKEYACTSGSCEI